MCSDLARRLSFAGAGIHGASSTGDISLRCVPCATCTVAAALKRPRAGVARDEETLQPTVYLNKLPDTFQPDTRVLVTDPMLATGARAALTFPCVLQLTALCAGGSLCTCLDALIARGVAVSNIRVVGVVAAPPALKRLSENYPGALERCGRGLRDVRSPCRMRRTSSVRGHD